MFVRPKGYCHHCGNQQPYKLKFIESETSFSGVPFTYEEAQAICKKCNTRINVPALDDRNWYEKHKAYYNKLHETFKEDKDEH